MSQPAVRKTSDAGPLDGLRGPAEAIVREQLAALPALLEDVVEGRVRMF
jgi:hypothetical protein